MKNNLRYWAGAAAATLFALGISSCAYDPYYSSASVGEPYRSGYGGSYGDGYGYGGSSFSTSLFVGTGNDRWGYDPDTYSYYDYHRHAYYDPYLNGYYPVGYRPQVVYGVPHPYGWHPGGGYIRPPGRVYDSYLGNYREREYSYRNSRYDWARQVRRGPVERGRAVDSHSSRYPYDRGGSQSSNARYNSGSRSSNSYIRQGQPNYRTEEPRQESYRSPSREQSRDRLPSSYYTPVNQNQSYHQRGPKQEARYSAPQKHENSGRSSNEGRSNGGRSEEDRGKIRGYR